MEKSDKENLPFNFETLTLQEKQDSLQKNQELADDNNPAFDLSKTSRFGSIDGFSVEFNRHLKDASISMERHNQEDQHPYTCLLQVKSAMEELNNKLFILERLRELNLSQNSQERKKSEKKKKRHPSKNKRAKLNFKSIGRKTKKVSDSSPKKQVESLKLLLENENNHLYAEDRSRLINYIFELAPSIKAYSEILDKKIDNLERILKNKEKNNKELAVLKEVNKAKDKIKRS